MRIKKFNEAEVNENLGIPTYMELLDMIENDEIKLVNTDKDDFINHIDRSLQWNIGRGRDISNNPIANPGSIRDGIIYDGDAIYVMDGNRPIAVIIEYELMNPFVFGDVIVVPGHDSITCYNLKTGESTTEHIR